MRQLRVLALALLMLAGCGRQKASGPTSGPAGEETVSLPEARRGFATRLTRKEKDGTPLPTPPAKLFRIVRYDSPVGPLGAYLTPAPPDGKRRPALIWITGGDCNSVGDVWRKAPAKNDQTATAYREAGIVMMFPSLRGGNDNPGIKEGFFGEVDDVLAAADYLAKQDFVDPQRIYLGGHSTGGTLVLLVAACSDRFRAVFSFGPVEDVRGYGPEYCPFDTSNPREAELRAPGRWLHSIKSPVFVIEGANPDANITSLNALARASRNPLVRFHPVPGGDHFNVLFPVNRLLARKVLADDGPTTNIVLTEQELSGLVR